MIWENVKPLVDKLVDDHSVVEWERLFTKWDAQTWHDGDAPTEQTNVLMVDANAVTTDGTPNLDALHELLKDHVQASISDLYLVSLFPYAVTPTDTRVDPRIRLAEDLAHVKHEFDLMYDVTPDVYNEFQFDLLKETDALLERLAQGATKLRIHVQSLRGMPEERIQSVLRLWHTVLHHYKPNAQLVLAYEGDMDVSYFEVADAICHFDLASHMLLAFAQGDARRLTDWAKQIKTPKEKTYFNFLSIQERDPFEKNLIEPSADMLLAAHSILFSLQGIPSVDYRTLLGVNTPVERDTLVHELKTDPYRLNVFSGIMGQLNVKRAHVAFSPYASQQILQEDRRVFAVERRGGEAVLTLYTNVSNETVTIDKAGMNMFTGEEVEKIELAPYQYTWIEN